MSNTNITEKDLSDDLINLLHYIDSKLEENGGECAVSDIVFSIQHASIDISLHKGDIHKHITGKKPIRDNSDHYLNSLIEMSDNLHRDMITDVETVGSPPETLQQDQTPTESQPITTLDFPNCEGIQTTLKERLKKYGVHTISELAKETPETIKQIGEKIQREQSHDISVNDNLTESEQEELRSQGIETLYDLLIADVEEIIQNDSRDGITIPKSKIEHAQRDIKSNTPLREFTKTHAESIISKAQTSQPIGPELTEKALNKREQRIKEAGEERAIIKTTDVDTETVGEPLVKVRSDLTLDDEKAVYTSDLGINKDDPVNTGLPVLEPRPDYDPIPRLETNDSGQGSLPVDENGEIVKPAIPLERFRQVPLDECIAKSLANDEPVCIEGERGVGKNYLIQYICHKTNRGYRSFDARKGMTATDLFGPLTPDKDGKIEPKSAPLKQGLLNGDVIVINEFSAMNQGVGMSLHQLLEEGEITITAHGEHVKPHPATKIIITKNPATTDYKGNNEMNQATRGRFTYYWQTYPDSKNDEVETLSKQINNSRTYVERSVIENVVEFAHRTRKDENDNWPTISTRDCKSILNEVKKGFPPKGCVLGVMEKRKNRMQSLETAKSALNSIMN